MDRLFERLMHPRTIAVGSLLFFAAVAVGEHDFAGTVFVAAVAAVLVALVLTATPRPRFAVSVVVVVLTVVTAVSAAKMRFMGVALHAFDAFFYLHGAGNAAFLFGDFFLPVAAVAALASVGALVVIAIYRRDPPLRDTRRKAALALLPLFGLAVFTHPRQESDRLDSYYFGYHLTSSLFVSLGDVGSLFGEPDLVRRLANVPPSGTYSDASPCTAGEPRPDIVVALMESAFPPSLYPEMKAPPGLDAAFRSPDDRIRPLRVETFAGGTWITTASLFTGIPTTEFGWMRPYLPYYLHGRVHHSLIRAAERCGYDTLVVSPLAYGFVDEGPFLTSIGFRDYLDWKAIGAASKHERDAVYFDATLKRLKEHRAATNRPLLVFVMTMATHSPFDRRFASEVRLDGEPYGNGAETDEFLRRLVLQRRDFDAFAATLAADPGRNGTILVDFGDHQPVVTRPLAEARTPDALEHWGSIAYRTYYRIVGLGRDLAHPLPEVEALAVSFLGVTVAEAAGLPLDAAHRELAELRDVCGGRIDGCPDQTRLDRHLKRLVASGMLDLGAAAR